MRSISIEHRGKSCIASFVIVFMALTWLLFPMQVFGTKSSVPAEQPSSLQAAQAQTENQQQTDQSQSNQSQSGQSQTTQPQAGQATFAQNQQTAQQGSGMQITAQSAMVYCENTGETIYRKETSEKRSPYSITKLMTAILAVQKCPLDKKVTVSAQAASQKGSSAGLKKGEVVTVEELLYGALLESGNDAAYALGEAVSGSGNMSEFVDLMNETADNIGCHRTHFSNPTGIYSKSNYTTASDFMKIARVALANETVRKIAGTVRYHMGANNKSNGRTFVNKVGVLKKSASGIVAAKSGYGGDQDCSLAAIYNKNGLELCIVILTDTTAARYSDLSTLIDYAKGKVKGIRAIEKDKNVGKVHVNGGADTSLAVYTTEDGYAYLPKEGSRKLITTKSVIDKDVTAPVKAGQRVGTYNIYVSGELVNSIPLVVKEGTETGWLPSKIGISNFATTIIGIILLCLLLFRLYIGHLRRKARKRRALARKRQVERLARKRLMEEERARRDRYRRY